MSRRWSEVWGTFFYTGYFPAGPGTFATAAATIMAVFLSQWTWLYVVVFCVLTIIGFQVSGRMEKITGQTDPSCVVIDEAAGVMIALFLLPLTWPVIIITFFLFRAFDMFKIYPVNKFEELPGGQGIMMDDLIAGLYTNVSMHASLFLIHQFF